MVLPSTQLQKVSVTLWLHRLQCLVKRSALSVFINLRYAECVCLYYWLRVCSQTNKVNYLNFSVKANQSTVSSILLTKRASSSMVVLLITLTADFSLPLVQCCSMSPTFTMAAPSMGVASKNSPSASWTWKHKLLIFPQRWIFLFWQFSQWLKPCHTGLSPKSFPLSCSAIRTAMKHLFCTPCSSVIIMADERTESTHSDFSEHCTCWFQLPQK